MRKLLPIIIVVIVVVGAAFYGGMKYGESKKVGSGIFQEERMQMRQRLGADMSLGLKGGQLGEHAGAVLVNGEIIAKDEQSITVKLQDGGSKIIFFSESTKITKSVDGTGDDLKEGEQIFVSGKENPDGSYTATNIRIGGFQQGE